VAWYLLVDIKAYEEISGRDDRRLGALQAPQVAVA
jgi:hypothetical protein